MNKRLIFAVAVLLLLAAGGGAVAWSQFQGSGLQRAAQFPTVEEKDKGSAPHPLSRDSIAGRTYPGSPITVEQDLGEQGGFRMYVVSYRSDNFKINSLMNVPNGQPPAGGWPVLIFNHGYFPPREYQTVSVDYRTWTDGLARAGYLVFKPDYRGHAQSEGESAGGNWSPEYTYDILNLISSLKQYPQANPAKIGQFGHSMGGNVSIRVAEVSPDVRATVTLGGVVGSPEDLIYRWRRLGMVQESPPPGGFGRVRQQLIEHYGDPKDNGEFWNTVSLTANVGHIAGPVQIHHGEADASVPKQFSDSLHTALVQSGKPVEYFVYPGGDHYFTGNGGLALQRMLALFNAHVKR